MAQLVALCVFDQSQYDALKKKKSIHLDHTILCKTHDHIPKGTSKLSPASVLLALSQRVIHVPQIPCLSIPFRCCPTRGPGNWVPRAHSCSPVMW